MSTIDVLKRARELLTEGWTRGTYARDAEDQPTTSVSDKACSWCAVGALRRATSDVLYGSYWDGTRLYDEASSIVKKSIPNSEIYIFNDAQETVEPVLAVFDKAIAQLEVSA